MRRLPRGPAADFQACHCAPPDEKGPKFVIARLRRSRGNLAGAVAISQHRPEHGKAPGEFATAFPRLPRRACALLAMTREEGTPKFVIARLRRSRGNLAAPAGTRESPGEFATAFPRLPRRACALLAMTREEGTPKFVIARLRRSRGNLAAPAGTRESPRRIRNCLPEIAASGLRPPRNDTGRRHSQVCHCEAPQEPWQSRRMQPEHGKAPGEFASAQPGPASPPLYIPSCKKPRAGHWPALVLCSVTASRSA